MGPSPVTIRYAPWASDIPTYRCPSDLSLGSHPSDAPTMRHALVIHRAVPVLAEQDSQSGIKVALLG